MSNQYQLTFYSTCPIDGAVIPYDLTLRTSAEVIRAEHVVARCRMFSKTPSMHEGIADQLAEAFPGHQFLVAVHGGVTITTERGAE